MPRVESRRRPLSSLALLVKTELKVTVGTEARRCHFHAGYVLREMEVADLSMF